jgi:hypothetical protein
VLNILKLECGSDYSLAAKGFPNYDFDL